MKKTLLATALAVGFASAVSAQTSVTLYGRVDGGVGHTTFKNKGVEGLVLNPDGSVLKNDRRPSKATKSGAHGGVQSGNRWGLLGSEDLGDGLKAQFQLESGFDLFTGRGSQGGRLFGRQAWFGLSGDSWGKISYGRQYNIADGYVGGVIAAHGDAYDVGHIGASFTSVSMRYDNMFIYETPSFDGFQVGVGYTFNADGSQHWKYKDGAAAYPANPLDVTHVHPDENRKAFSAAMKYENGPLAVVASYDVLYKAKGVDTKAASVVAVTVPSGGLPPGSYVLPVTSTKAGYRPYALGEEREKDVKAWILGASYDFDAVKLHMGYGQDKNGVFGGRETPDLLDTLGQDSGYIRGYKTNNYSLGVTVPLDSSALTLNWQTARLASGVYKDGEMVPDGSGGYTFDPPTAKKSKQTLYTASYTYNLSKRTNLYAVATKGSGYAFDDVSVTQAIVGLRHQF